MSTSFSSLVWSAFIALYLFSEGIFLSAGSRCSPWEPLSPSSLWIGFSCLFYGVVRQRTAIGGVFPLCACSFYGGELENNSEVYCFIPSPPRRMKRCSHSLVSLGGARSHPAVPAIWRELPWTPLSHDHTQESSSTNHQMFALSCMMTMPWGTHCPLSAPINSVPWMDISEVSVWGFLWPRKGSS